MGSSMHYSMILVCLSMIVQTPCRWSTRIPSAMRISASSRPMLNGSFKNTNPTSRTTLICVAVMTGDEDSLNPLAYASSPKTVVLAAAIPASIISDNPLVVLIVPGCHTRRIAKTTAVNGSATPEMMSAPKAGLIERQTTAEQGGYSPEHLRHDCLLVRTSRSHKEGVMYE